MGAQISPQITPMAKMEAEAIKALMEAQKFAEF